MFRCLGSSAKEVYTVTAFEPVGLPGGPCEPMEQPLGRDTSHPIHPEALKLQRRLVKVEEEGLVRWLQIVYNLSTTCQTCRMFGMTVFQLTKRPEMDEDRSPQVTPTDLLFIRDGAVGTGTRA